jgi:hypothetical protein
LLGSLLAAERPQSSAAAASHDDGVVHVMPFV